MKIIPAVLSDNLQDYVDALEFFEGLHENTKAHIDIMDGEFVETTSADLEDVLEIETKLERQVHLMVQDAMEQIELCVESGVEEVAFHFQSDVTLEEIKNLDKKDTKLFLTINPEVESNEILDWLDHIDGILIMTITPGVQGNPFMKNELNEVEFLRQNGFEKTIVIDGHVAPESMKEIKKYQIDELVVGSAIIKQADPEAAYENLKKLANN